MDFSAFKFPVGAQFEKISKFDLFSVEVDKDLLWSTYLSSFPPGSDPIFRERTQHDCSCCKQFIRAIGDVVAIVDNQIVSIWDITSQEPAYQVVADEMARLIREKAIDNIFLHPESKVGQDKTFEQLTSGVTTWTHFYATLPAKFVCKGADIGPRLSKTRADHDVLFRSLEELSDEAVETVLELISQGSLYRGDENKSTLVGFDKLKKQYNKLLHRQAPLAERHRFVWSRVNNLSPAIMRIRNTSIGTLLIDLSEGLDVDAAVRKFESVVAPANYQRPTALVTKKMIDKAKATIEELSLMSALERRYAHLTDIGVNDILYADRSAKKVLEGDVFDSLATRAGPVKSLDKVEEITIDKFISEILPRAESIEVQVENRHAPNFVSLIAPSDPTANNMFKWDNKFSWSYAGDMADSIKERVKRAGGNVTGDVLFRLAWYNFDDLDFHMREPDGNEIYFGNKGVSRCGGQLDVDMNAGFGTTREPVENIFYSSMNRMKEGRYELYVYNFAKRENTDVGFEVEFDCQGTTYSYVYEQAVRDRTSVSVVTFNYSQKNGIEIIKSLPSTQVSKEIWGVKTQEFKKVNVIMLSPNYWEGQAVGNKHFFFMIDGCQNDGTARGFFNEFLKPELNPHRKVIEMVGAKMKTHESVNQLSGLGFSSTQRNELLVRVRGAFTRVIKVMF